MATTNLQALVSYTLAAYQDSFKDAFKAMVRSWILCPASGLLALAYLLVIALVRSLPLGIAGGFIIGLFSAACISVYYSWLNLIINHKKLAKHDLLVFDQSMFSAVISVGFIFWIFSFVLESLVAGLNAAVIIMIGKLFVNFMFNPIAETLILRRSGGHGSDGLSSLQYAATFLSTNIFEWLIPNLLLFLPLIFFTHGSTHAIQLFANFHPLIPALGIIDFQTRIMNFLFGSSLNNWVIFIFGSLFLGNSFALFRGFLFVRLDGSSHRSRLYKWRTQ